MIIKYLKIVDKNKFFSPIYILFYFLSIYYFIFPAFFLLLKKYNIILWSLHYEYNVDFLLFRFNEVVLVSFIIFIIFFFLIKIIFFDVLSKKKNLIELNKDLYNKILLFFFYLGLIFLIYDLILIIKFYFSFFQNDIIQDKNFNLRSYIFYNILDKRNTALKIFLIISVYFFITENHKKLGIVGIVLLFFYNFITLGRYEVFILLWLLFILDYKNLFKKKKIIYLFTASALIFLVSYYLRFNTDVRQVFGEMRALLISQIIFKINFFDYIQDGQYNFNLFLNNNCNYLMKSFFYINAEVIDFWKSNVLVNKYSNHGITFVFIYPLVIFFYILMLSFLKIYGYLNGDFLKVCITYVLINSIRGNSVHELGFVIKLNLLILIIFLTFKFFKKNFK